MDKTRSRIILYALTGMAALSVPVLFFDGVKSNPLLLPSLAPALVAIALLARTCLAQLDAAHSLSLQLGQMIEQQDIRHLFIPTPDTPEMNAVGHQLNVLIYTLVESAYEARTVAPRFEADSDRAAFRSDRTIELTAVPDAA